MNLKRSQTDAIGHIERYALSRVDKAKKTIEEVRSMCHISRDDLDGAVHHIKTSGRIALHFHPDRLDEEGKTVAKSLFETGLYKNQFETKLSNGMLSPYIGGPRDIWENNMFGKAYSSCDMPASERPKYGALDLMRHADGPCPRFGSCYFLLKPEVSRRSTFTYLDSSRDPREKGTLDIFEDILAGLLAECFEREYALGKTNITPPGLINHLSGKLAVPFQDPSNSPPTRNLNHCIEAQVHGDITLGNDVDILVADPSFKEDPIGELFSHLCEKYGIQLFWHGGFRLRVPDVRSDFRGPSMPSLAERVAGTEWLNVNMIGQAAQDLKRNPDKWKDRGTYEHCLQELKLLWHVLVKYGSSFSTTSGS